MAKRKRPTRSTAEPPFAKEERERAQRGKAYRTWLFRVQMARKARDQWLKDYEVERAENYFLGNQLESGRRDNRLVLNHFRATMKTMLPNLVIRSPKAIIRPKPGLTPPANETKAAAGEATLESIAEQDRNLEKSGGLALFQGFFRLGVIKTVFDPKPVPNPRAGEPIRATIDGEPVLDDVGNEVMERDPLTGEIRTEPEEVMTDNVYRYEWVDAATTLLPDEGPDQQKWTWIGEDITVSLEDAQQDRRFRKDLREQLRANVMNKPDKERRPTKTQPNPDDERVQYTELYDLKAKRWRVLAEGQNFEEFLVDEPLPQGVEDHPYALLALGDPILHPQPSPWPYPVTRDWIDPQKSYNANRKQVDQGARRAARKGYYTREMFPNLDEAQKAMESADDMSFAAVNDIKEVPVVQQDPPLSPDIYRSIDLSLGDLRVLAGQTGARLANPDTALATDALFAEQAASLRDAEFQRKVQGWLTDAFRKMFQLVQATMTFDLWVMIRGYSDRELQAYLERVMGVSIEQQTVLLQQFPGFKPLLRSRLGQSRWRRVTREELTFAADVTIEPGSARPKNTVAEQRTMLQIVPLILANPAIAKVPSFLRRVLKAFDIDDERLIEELQAVADLLIQINSNIAGRTSGGTASATSGAPDQLGLVNGVGQQLVGQGGG